LMQGKEQYFAIIPDAHHCFAAGPKWLVNMPLTISINSPWSRTLCVHVACVDSKTYAWFHRATTS
jgi:hypothetical protein